MTQTAMFAGHEEREIGDELDRCYTPEPLAHALVDVMVEVAGIVDLEPETWVEPSVGGGAFARSPWMQRHLVHSIGVDLDEDALGFDLVRELHVGSWPDIAATFRGQGRGVDVVVGNPPFSEALEHWRAACSVSKVVGMLMPLAYLGVGEWAGTLYGTGCSPTYIVPIVGRPWPARVRETAFYIRAPNPWEHATTVPCAVTAKGVRL